MDCEINKKDYLYYANIIGDELIRTAIQKRGIITWPMLDKINNSINHEIFDLLKGTLGNLFYLVHLYNETKKEEYLGFVRKCINQIQIQIDNKVLNYNSLYDTINYGFFIFIFGVVCNSQEQKEVGIKIITDNRDLSKSTLIDSYWGMSRELVLLLCIYNITTNDQIKEMIIEYAKMMTDEINCTCRGYNLKPDTVKPSPLIGFAHGSSGLAWVLSELVESFNLAGLPEIINLIHAYEDSWFNVISVKNKFTIISNDDRQFQRTNYWCDFRYIKRPFKNEYAVLLESYNNNRLSEFNEISLSHPIAFCNGNSGIVATRLRSQSILKNKKSLSNMKSILDIESNIDISPKTNIYNLCCGLGGTIECYLLGYQIFNEKKYIQFCQDILDASIDYYNTNREWRYLGVLDISDSEKEEKLNLEKFKYSFFKGISSIGYNILRVYKPVEYYSVLMPTTNKIFQINKRPQIMETHQLRTLKERMITKYWQHTLDLFHLLTSINVLEGYLNIKSPKTNDNEVFNFKYYIENKVRNIKSSKIKKIINEIIKAETYRIEFEIQNPILIDRYYEYYICNIKCGLDYINNLLKIQKDVKVFKLTEINRSYLFYITDINEPEIRLLNKLELEIVNTIISDRASNTMNYIINFIILKNGSQYSFEEVTTTIKSLYSLNIIQTIPSMNNLEILSSKNITN